MERLCSLISGGKDSVYATTLAKLSGNKISCGLCIIPKDDSWMFHIPFTKHIETIEKALNFPILKIKTEGKKEEELEDLKEGLTILKEKYRITGVVTGAIASEYQRMRINKICDKLGLTVYSPLWHKDYKQLLLEESQYLDFTIVKIAGEGLKKEWLGKIVKDDIVIEILNSKIINPVFEGGEAETLVLNAPIFKKRIVLKDKRIVENSDYDIDLHAKLELEDK